MSAWQAMVLGALQGATEFLPVSSSAHLVLVPWLLGWHANDLFFGVAVHVGTLLAVLYYFRDDVLSMLSAWWGTIRRRRIDDGPGRLAWLVIVGTIPAGIAGVLLEDWFEAMFSTPRLVSILLLVTGLILTLAEALARRAARISEVHSVADALIIGLAQAVAIAPGISRSGATISAGLARGLPRPEAARFSFLLAIPVIAAGGLLEVAKVVLDGDSGSLALGAIGALVAAVVGYAAIGGLMRYLRRQSLMHFAYYCWAFGGLCLLLSLLRG